MASQNPTLGQRLISRVAPIFEVLMDLILSLIGYVVLISVLFAPVYYSLWTFYFSTLDRPSVVEADALYRKVAWGCALVPWIARFLLRWRRHLRCMLGSLWHYLRHFLLWLSPLSTEPYKACPCCPMVTSEKPRYEEHRCVKEERGDVYSDQRSFGVFL